MGKWMYLAASNKINMPCVSHRGLRPTPARQTLHRGQQTQPERCMGLPNNVSYSLGGLWCALCQRLVRSEICKAQVSAHVCYLCLVFSGNDLLLSAKNWTQMSLFSRTWLWWRLWNCCGTCLFEGTSPIFIIWLPAFPWNLNPNYY